MLKELEDREHPYLWYNGSVNYTRLAENAAWHFNRDQWLDDMDHWIWDLAVDVGDSVQHSERCGGERRSGTGLSNCRSPFGFGCF